PTERHPYYRTLYGKAPHTVVDELISLSLLYDRICLAPADCPLPDWQTHSDGCQYNHQGLGVISDWEWEGDRQQLDDLVSYALTDFHVQDQIRHIPPRSHRQIVHTAIVQLNIRDAFGADLLAGSAHLRLCNRLAQLLVNE